MVPEGWDLTVIEKHIDLLSGFAFRSTGYSIDDYDVRLLRGDNIAPGTLRWDNCKRWPKNNAEGLEKYQLQAGDFVIAMDRTWVSAGLKVAEVRDDDLPCLLVQRVSRIRAKRSFTQSLLKQIFSTHRFEQYVKGVQTETAVPHISAKQIKEFPVLVPPPEEQTKIAEILSTWDETIETVEKLIENSRTQKKTLMQQLLTGKKRLPGFSKPWREVRLNKVFDRVTRKNTIGNDNVLTISGQHGLVNQRDYFSKSVASDNLGGYTLLAKGDFAYNKSYSKGYPMGAIKPLTKYDWGVVSSLYICFRLKANKPCSQEFFRHYFEAGIFNREIYAIAQEGARNHGLLNVSVTDFFNAKLHIPEPDEKEAIEKVIRTAERELHNLEAQLESLQNQKKALMQQLLTGKRRVKVEDAH